MHKTTTEKLFYSRHSYLAADLIAETCLKHEIEPGRLIPHADHGPSMRSTKVGKLLDDLDGTKTQSRPYVSNDNPYSEFTFKTLKHRDEFPDRFDSIGEARAFCQQFFRWYCTKQHHSGIAMLTPESVHYGTYPEILTARRQTLQQAYIEHPERVVRGVPTVEDLPKQVWINKPATEETVMIQSAIAVFPPTELIK
jgi:putative transposase